MRAIVARWINWRENIAFPIPAPVFAVALVWLITRLNE